MEKAKNKSTDLLGAGMHRSASVTSFRSIDSATFEADLAYEWIPQQTPRNSISSLSLMDHEHEYVDPDDDKRQEKLKTLSEKEQRFQLGANELYHTEVKFAADMSLLVQMFFKPLTEQGILSQEQVHSIFTDEFPSFVIIHEVILKELMECREDGIFKPGLGLLFEHQAATLQAYSVYFFNYTKALQNITELKQKNTKFHSFLKKNASDPRLKNLALGDYLIKPIQRVTKYPLLLADLSKHCEHDPKEKEELSLALEKIKLVVNQLNQRQKLQENHLKLEEIINRINHIRTF
eukprot:Lithocolla_globosa_v1_NODE_3954_length_1544_cov_10.349228.p1 type:complete len:292 gc:universal NODE_3954_length_1544_cov_10.349228:1465-590(-)